MIKEVEKKVLDYLQEQDEVAFVENNCIVFIQKCEDGYDYSFFKNRIGYSENEDSPVLDDFEQSDFDEDLIDGGQIDSDNSNNVLEYCINTANEIDWSVDVSSEVDNICQECWDPDCSGCQ